MLGSGLASGDAGHVRIAARRGRTRPVRCSAGYMQAPDITFLRGIISAGMKRVAFEQPSGGQIQGSGEAVFFQRMDCIA